MDWIESKIIEIVNGSSEHVDSVDIIHQIKVEGKTMDDVLDALSSMSDQNNPNRSLNRVYAGVISWYEIIKK